MALQSVAHLAISAQRMPTPATGAASAHIKKSHQLGCDGRNPALGLEITDAVPLHTHAVYCGASQGARQLSPHDDLTRMTKQASTEGQQACWALSENHSHVSKAAAPPTTTSHLPHHVMHIPVL